jgi:very-short-patch-repair endonuclease
MTCFITSQKLCTKDDCNLCFEKSFMSNPKSAFWNYELNNNLNPRNVFKSSGKKFWFRCEICSHNFESSLANINNGQWCPYCANPPKKLCDKDDCDLCFEKSFVSHEKSKFWNYELNNNLNPRNIFKNCNKKHWFKCEICNHSFNTSLNKINGSNRWCSYCSNHRLCNNEDCKMCLEKSFKANPKSKFWNCELNNNLNPRTIFKNSHNKYYFNCEICNHSFNASLGHINEGTWCLYCANKKLCKNNDCCHCFEKSFKANPKSKYWNFELNNDINPRDVFKGSQKKYYFNCEICKHSFQQRLGDTNKGRWCPICKNKTEKIVYEFLLENNFKIIKEAKFDWCKNEETDYHFRFDFVIESFKLIIEIDGRQHFEEVKHWKNDFKKNQERDKYKMELATKNNYSIIRIVQEDIYYNKYDWKKELLVNIKKYDNPEMIYMCKKEEYECY